MKKLLFLTLTFLFLSQLIQAQDIPSSHPQPDSIIKVIPAGEGRHTFYLYTIGGKLQTAEDVKFRLLSYEPSATEYSMAKNNLTWGWVTFGGFAASSLGATIEFAENNKHAGETTGIVNGQAAFIYQQHSLTGAYLFTTAAVGFLTASIITLVSASHHAKQALSVYNHRFE
jgi:hypothetical protein